MADEKKCSPLNHPNLVPSWVCCACVAKGAGTMNGNNRDQCKACGHARCDAPKTMQVPIKEENGMRIITVNTGADKSKAN